MLYRSGVLVVLCMLLFSVSSVSANMLPCDEAGLDAAIAAGGVQHLNCNVPMTITVTGPKTITNTLILNGQGLLTLSGGGEHQIFYVDKGDLSLNNMQLRNGVSLNGGAIYNTGTLTLTHTQVIHNQATGTATLNGGGAIYNNGGTLNIYNSTLSDNAANNDGGAIMNGFGTVHIAYSTMNNNQSGDDGGAIWNESGSIIITHSTFSNNQAIQDGGALFNRSVFGTATVHIMNSTFSANHATGESGDGGAIYTTSRTGTIVNMYIDHTTLIDNTANDAGSGIFNRVNGGGTSTVTITNSIILNQQGDDCVAQAGAVFLGTANADGTGSSCPDSAAMIKAIHISPILAANGGVTQTHALLDVTNNPAIDRLGNCATSDQRGVGRDATCDLGAYEQSTAAFITPIIEFSRLSDSEGVMLRFIVPDDVALVEDVDLVWMDLSVESVIGMSVNFDCDTVACVHVQQSPSLFTKADDDLILMSVHGPVAVQ